MPPGSSRLRAALHKALRTPGPRRRATLYGELASMLQAGMGPRDAVPALAGVGGARAAALIDVWREQVQQGAPLNEGMAGRLDVFSPPEVSLVRMGERSGQLVDALRRLAARLESEHATRLQMLGAAAYPVLVIHVAILLPTIPLVAMTKGFAVWLTLVLVALSVVWGVPAALACLYLARRDDPVFARRVCTLPLIGRALHLGAVERFAWTLGAMHDAGEDAEATLAEAIAAADSGWFRSRAEGALASIREGGSLAEAVGWLEAVPADVRGMVATGEQSGALTETMERAAQLYEERRVRALRSSAVALGALLFCLALVVVLVAVFGVFFLVYGPLFEMTR